MIHTTLPIRRSRMNLSSRAISSSRPSGAPGSPLATASKPLGTVADDQADRQAARHHLPRRRAGGQRAPRASAAGPRRGAPSPRSAIGWRLALFGAAVAAVVEQEDLDRPVADAAVEPFGIAAVDRQRRGTRSCAWRARAASSATDATVVARIAVLAPLRIPVVAHFVVVPHASAAPPAVEAAHVRVLQVVAIVAAELVHRLGRLRLGRAGQAAPGAAAVERHGEARPAGRRRWCRRG